MKYQLLPSMAALGLALSTTPASAGLFSFEPSQSSFYIGASLGGSFLDDATFTGISNPEAGIPGPTGVAGVPVSVALDYEDALSYGGVIGWQLPFKYWTYFHPRVELEVSYAEHDVDAGAFNGGTQVFSGEQSVLSVYINNYSDIIVSDDQKVIPYVGGGLGYISVDSDVGYFGGTATAPTFAVTRDDSVFAGHFALGLTYKVTEQAELYGEGRYVQTYDDVQLERTFIGDGANLFNASVESELEGFNATGGIRFRF